MLIANWLCAASFFIAKDLVNAPDDALAEHTDIENPIAQGWLRPTHAVVILWITVFVALGLFFILGWLGSTGWMPLILGMSGLAMGQSTIQRLHHTKRSSILDLTMQPLLFTTLQILSGYFIFKSHLSTSLIFSLLTIVNLSIYHALSSTVNDPEKKQIILFNQAIDPQFQRKVHFFMITTLTIGVISGFIWIVFMRVITLEILVLMVILAIIFCLPLIKRIINKAQFIEIQKPLYKGIEKAVSLGLMMQFFIPLILQYFR